ncbi:MAG TPA: sodium:proton antiporter [Tepidisphaeraceae bacterium]|jgi:CPA1 family monovalent cation:H+ antiporter
MELFDVIAILLTLTALLSYFNHRYLRMPPSIGVMLIALLLSLGLIALGEEGIGVRRWAIEFMRHIEFGRALLTWMLGFLLFAGALGVDLGELQRHWRITAVLATAGTAATALIVGVLTHWLLPHIGMNLSWTGCLLFGALISPTDPVAVMAVIRQAGASQAIETVVASESLLNDGVGVVLFLTIQQAAAEPGHVTASGVGIMLLREVGGGAIIGFCTGLLIYHLLKSAHNFQVEVLLTLALVMGTYSLTSALDMSAPIAVVVAGLLIGNRGGIFHTAEQVSEYLQRFWELIDEILNAVLFVLIGLEILVMPYTPRHFLAAVIAIPIVLAARAATLLPFVPRVGWGTAGILVWGGLRGGLAVAMALSLPEGPGRNLTVAITYGVVCFSILVQGTTIRSLVKRTIPAS